MTFVKNSYVARRVSKGFRNWFLIKADASIQLNQLFFPKELVGKKVRLKVEVIDDEIISKVKK